MWRELANWPNFFTVLRILLIPAVVAFLTDPGPTAALAATTTFFLASLSDFLDGYLARRYGLTTTLGKILDPLADKLIVAAVLVMLVAMDRTPHVPGWAVAVMISREIAVTGLRAVALAQGVIVEAETLGKYKMVLQMFALHGLLLHYPFFGIDFFSVGMYFFWLALVVAVWSGLEYYRHVLPRLWQTGTPAPLPR
ncbi:MAG: CDP-diacylglycerol--glycerol-3-phosphate 3-phosphatidyltransferase [Candidatus Binatia bacterium]|nr:MAG: CDP-diacylglycerol--glycerol-3-phosphate 3-phosphatidyltransferase [Candidatus Binatia bacterium]